MSESEVGQPESLKGKIEPQSNTMPGQPSGGTRSISPWPEAEGPGSKPRVHVKELPSQLERFSSVSSQMIGLLSELSDEVKKAADQLRELRAEVENKKKELKALHDIELSTAELEQLMQDHRAHKESLEFLLESHRSIRAEEQTRLAQEEKEYMERLRVERQREEEEYRHRWAEEQSKIKQKLEEELRKSRKVQLEKQESLEDGFLRREQLLKEKELGCIRLIQELEQLMSRLTTRIQS